MNFRTGSSSDNSGIEFSGTLSAYDLVSVKLLPHEHRIIKLCDESNRPSDKLLAFRMIFQKLERQLQEEQERLNQQLEPIAIERGDK